MMTFPTEWKNKIHVPNHQPEIYPWLWDMTTKIAIKLSWKLAKKNLKIT